MLIKDGTNATQVQAVRQRPTDKLNTTAGGPVCCNCRHDIGTGEPMVQVAGGMAHVYPCAFGPIRG